MKRFQTGSIGEFSERLQIEAYVLEIQDEKKSAPARIHMRTNLMLPGARKTPFFLRGTMTMPSCLRDSIKVGTCLTFMADLYWDKSAPNLHIWMKNASAVETMKVSQLMHSHARQWYEDMGELFEDNIDLLDRELEEILTKVSAD